MSSITLVDPLVEHYARSVKGCAYRDGRLRGHAVNRLGLTAEELLGAPQLLGLGAGRRADTLVMIAVLQSVRDVLRALQAAYNALRVGGLLIFSDRVFDAKWEAYHLAGGPARGKPFWDVGHPCSVKQVVLDSFLSAFDELYSRRYSTPAKGGRPGDEQLYFIGRKLG